MGINVGPQFTPKNTRNRLLWDGGGKTLLMAFVRPWNSVARLEFIKNEDIGEKEFSKPCPSSFTDRRIIFLFVFAPV